MALTPEQRQAIFAGIDLNTIDDYASNPDSLIEIMSNEDYKQGLKCGTLSLEQLNYLFLAGFLTTQKALAESRAYTDIQINSKANFCNILASDSGQLLQYRPQADGSCKIYYGIEPPANLLNQYVDPVNGNDSNSGTRASPLRTIVYAIDRLPTGSRASIYLEESTQHYWKSTDRRSIDKTIYFYTYGSGTDAAQAQWDSDLSGWAWFGWQNAPKATIEFIHDGLIGGSEPGKHKAGQIEVLNGYSVIFAGIRFKTPPDVNMTNQPFWRSPISGNGDIILIDGAIDADQLPLFGSSPDQQPRITLDVVDVVGASPLFVLGSGGKITVAAYDRSAGITNPQGFLFNNGASIASYASKVQNRATAVPMSPNFDANF